MAVQAGQSDLSGIAQAVLGVRVVPHAAAAQSNWAARPLAPAQAHHAMQAAWLQALLLERLGGAVGWHEQALAACAPRFSDR